MLQSLACQTTARTFEYFEATGRSLMEMMVFAPEMLPQSSVTMLPFNILSVIVANQLTTLLVSRTICDLEAATILWMNTSYLQPRI
jgi:hypothetical protein